MSGEVAQLPEPQPEGADIVDVDAIMAERVEKPPYVFRFGGEIYNLPPRADFRAIAAMSQGELDKAMRLLMGQSQWERLQDAEAVFTDETLKVVMDGYQAHMGEDLGESKASTRSSKNTARR